MLQKNWWEQDEVVSDDGPAPIAGPPRLPSPQTAPQAQIDQNRAAATSYDPTIAAANARKAAADAAKAERDLAQPISITDDQLKLKGKMGSLQALEEQINRVSELYGKNIAGQPADRAFGLTEMLPTPTNRQFDAAAAGLAEQGLAAFRVPGVGSQSDAELRQFIAANKPSASDYDTSIEEKLRQLRVRVDATRQQLGMPPAEWQEAAPTQGMDRTQRMMVSPSNADQVSVATGATRTESNPAFAGANARVNAMIKKGATNAQILSYLKSIGADEKALVTTAGDLVKLREWQKQNPGYKGDYRLDLEKQVVPNEPLSQMGTSPYGAAAINFADGLSMGTLDNMTGNPDLTRAGMAGVQQLNPISSMLGTIAGGATAAGLGELGALRLGLQGGRAALAGDALYGAGAGAGNADDGNRALGALMGAGAGTAGGIAGRKVVSGAGRALTGSRDAATRYLNQRGIPMTVGQIAGQGGIVGRTVKGLEDKLESIPFLGDAIKARRTAGYTAFNKEGFSQALEPIGQQAVEAVAEEGVDSAKSAVSGAYKQALDGVIVSADKAFVRDMKRSMAAGQRLPGEMVDHFRNVVETSVAPYLENGTLTGEGFQAARQALRGEMAAWKGRPSGNAMRNVLRQVETSMEAMVRRRAPNVVPALNAADRAYGRTKVVENAVGRAINTEGVFSPAQLGLAARQSGNKFGGTGSSTDRPFFDLQRAGQEILPSQVPDSGTAGRALAAAIPMGAAGVGYQQDWLSAHNAAIMASLGLPYTAAGQRTFQALLVSRPEVVRRAGEQILRARNAGGLLAAPAAVTALPPQ